MNIIITESARDRLEKTLESNQALRISIKGSGCSGFQYVFEVDTPNANDHGFCNGKIIIDPMSIHYLDGSTIDFKNEIFSQMFVIENPQAKQICGCGSSFGV